MIDFILTAISNLLHSTSTIAVWARSRIVELLKGIAPTGPSGAGAIAGYRLSIKEAVCEGDAQVAVNRGKRKYICDFTATVTWIAAGADGTEFEGQLIINDVTADKEYEFDVTYPSISTVFTQATRSALKVPLDSMKKSVVAQLDVFFAEYTAK
jgi:activator of HSP90 ATPase